MKPCALLDPKTACCKSKWLAHGLKHEGGHRCNADWSWAEKLGRINSDMLSMLCRLRQNPEIFPFESVYLDDNTAEKWCGFIWKCLIEELNGDYVGVLLVPSSPIF